MAKVLRGIVFESIAGVGIAPLILARMIVIAVMLVTVKVIIAGVHFIVGKKLFHLKTGLFLESLQTRLLLLHCA